MAVKVTPKITAAQRKTAKIPLWHRCAGCGGNVEECECPAVPAKPKTSTVKPTTATVKPYTKEQERLDTMSRFDIMLEELRKTAKKPSEYIKLLEAALLDITDGVKDHEIERDYGLPEDDAFRVIGVRMIAQEARDARK